SIVSNARPPCERTPLGKAGSRQRPTWEPMMSFLSRIGQRQAGRVLNPRRAIVAAVAAASLVTLGACTIVTDRSTDDTSATGEKQEKKVGITASVKDGAEGVNLTETVTLTSDKAMSDVSLMDGAGNVIEGKLKIGRASWREIGRILA